MITQKLISLKLDVSQLELLDDLAVRLGSNRNKLINFAVYMLTSNMDTFKECSLIAVYSRALSEIK